MLSVLLSEPGAKNARPFDHEPYLIESFPHFGDLTFDVRIPDVAARIANVAAPSVAQILRHAELDDTAQATRESYERLVRARAAHRSQGLYGPSPVRCRARGAYQRVLMLQSSELALHGGAAPVEPAPFVALARDAQVALALSLAERYHRRHVTLGALSVNAVVAVAHVEHSRARREAASGDGVEKRSNVVGLVATTECRRRARCGVTVAAYATGETLAYSFGRRLRPPRGTMYMSTINATMTTAAMATIETVETARITRKFSPLGVPENLRGGSNRVR
jgi:hypothetical protein